MENIFDAVETDKNNMTKIIKNEGIFSAEYIPERIKFREQETKEIAEFMIFSKNAKGVLKLSGDYGTGKTVVVRYLKEELEKNDKHKDVKPIYINCNSANTKYKIFSEIHKHLHSLDVPKYGVPDNYLIDGIQTAMNNYSSMVIVLDEVNKIQKETDELLYTLCEMDKTSLILISNQSNWEDTLTGSVKSRLDRAKNIRFQRYTLFELEDILNQRAEKALEHGTYTDETISYIANYILTEGDARSLIHLLFISAQEAERERKLGISKESIDSAKFKMHRNILLDDLKELPLTKKYLLLLIAKSQGAGNPASTDDLHMKYNQNVVPDHNNTMEYTISTLSKPTIYRLVDEMLEHATIMKERGEYIKGVGRKPFIFKSYFNYEELIGIFKEEKDKVK